MKVTLTDNNREIEIVLPTTDRTLKAELYTLRLADYSIRKPVTIKSVNSPVALSVLNGRTVKLDELNYLAKRLDSFDNSELHQFYSGLNHEGFVNLKDMINLTFNIHRYALLTDVSSPASIGRKYILSTQGCIPADDSDDKMYENIGKQLIEEGKFKLTEYGILVVNDAPFEKVYDGLNFPEYHYYDSFLAVDLEHEEKKEFVAIAEDPESLNTAAERLGAESPEDCDVTINSYHVDMEPIIPTFQQILEVEGVIKLSQLVSELANEKMDWAKLRAVADYAEVRSAKNLNIIADRLDEFIYIPKANDEDDVGRYYVNDYKDGNVYSLGIDMEKYFDFQAFGEYMMEGFSIPEDYKMPLSEDEPYSPIVVELGDYDVLNEPTKKIKCFLPMDEEMRENAVKELGVNSFDDTCITDIQSCIPGVDTHYLPGNIFDDLNNIAFMYTKLSAMEKITFKALCEAEKPGSLRAYYGVNDRLSEYQMSYYVPDEGNFFKEYLSHHLPIKMDKQWLSTLLTHEEGERLLKALGATKTSYGILPARGQDLYMLVPYDYDKSMPITQDDHEYEVIEVCGQTGLYVDNREDSMKVPDGCYRYDFREGDDGDIATLEKSVNVNFGGSVFVKEPIEIPEDGYIEMDEDSLPNFTGDAMTIAEFAETDLSQLNQGEGMGGIS